MVCLCLCLCVGVGVCLCVGVLPRMVGVALEPQAVLGREPLVWRRRVRFGARGAGFGPDGRRGCCRGRGVEVADGRHGREERDGVLHRFECEGHPALVGDGRYFEAGGSWK